ncbi:MAG: hypothetical protein ABIR24_06670 [Verrucomicrobiota bacterium]
MKLFSIILICCVVFLPDLRAQNNGVSAVTVELSLDQEQFLSNEDLRVAVRITNRSGQKLTFGNEADWVTFTVQARDNYVVSQLGDVPVVGEFSLESSTTGTKRVNLTPYFNFRQPGRYQITATVKVPQWNKEITSRPKTFDIINGTKLREFDFGLPLPAGATNAQPEMRKYILQQALYLKQMKLYLRLTDATGSVVLKVFPIAPMVSSSQPEVQIDRLSHLHVLHQVGAHSFNYSVINPDGEIITQQILDQVTTRPKLRVDADGKISASGGMQRKNSNTLARPATAQSPDNNAQPRTP